MSRITESLDFESNTKNFKFPFQTMCKKYGKEFIELLQGMWQANGDSQTEEEFCNMNDITKSFFDKKIKI